MQRRVDMLSKDELEMQELLNMDDNELSRHADDTAGYDMPEGFDEGDVIPEVKPDALIEEDIDYEDNYIEDKEDEADDLPQDEIDEQEPQSTNEEPDDNSNPVEDNPYLDLEANGNKKIIIKWNGVEKEVKVSDLPKYAQIGIDAEIKDYKSAINFKKQNESKVIADSELDILNRLKSGDKTAIEDALALGKFKIDDVKDEIYEFEQSSIDDKRQVIEQGYVQPSEIQQVLESVPKETHEAFDNIAEVIPGLREFSKRVIDEGNIAHINNDKDKLETLTNYLSVVLDNTDNGAFKNIAPKAVDAYMSLTPREKQNIRISNDAFVQFYNKFLSEAATPSSDVETQNANSQIDNKPVTSRPSVDDINAKNSASRGSRGTPAKGNLKKPKQSNEDILNSYLGLIETNPDKFDNMIESGSLYE